MNLIERYNEEENLSIQVADIEPILIHCARELSARSDLADGGKIITDPVQDSGREGKCAGAATDTFCELEGLSFGTWRNIGAGTGGQPDSTGIFYRVVSAGTQSERTGSNRSVSAERGNVGSAENGRQDDGWNCWCGKSDTESGERKLKEDTAGTERSPLLLELLYCRQGCHMGDGVR